MFAGISIHLSLTQEHKAQSSRQGAQHPWPNEHWVIDSDVASSGLTRVQDWKFSLEQSLLRTTFKPQRPPVLGMWLAIYQRAKSWEFHWMDGYWSRTTRALPPIHRLPSHQMICQGRWIDDIILGMNLLAEPQPYRVLWDRTRETDDRNSESIFHYKIASLVAKQLPSLPVSVELWFPILFTEIGNQMWTQIQLPLWDKRPGLSWAHLPCAWDYHPSPKHSER